MIKIYKASENIPLTYVGFFVKIFDVGRQTLTKSDYQYIFSYSSNQYENSWGDFIIR